MIAAIIRKGEVMIPRGITTFEAGDEVLAVTDTEGAASLADLFSPAVRQQVERQLQTGVRSGPVQAVKLPR